MRFFPDNKCFSGADMTTIIRNRRCLSALSLAVCCVGITCSSASFANTPVVTTVLDEAPPPWDGQIRPSSTATQQRGATNGSGVAEWYQQRMNRRGVSATEIRSLQAAATGGDTEAAYQLALVYQSGQGVPVDQRKAQQLLERAAKSGHAYAQYALALLYRQLGEPTYIQPSVQWQQKAAQQGHVEAMYGLGLLYANGQHVRKDQRIARHWLQQAAQRNHAMARFALQDLAAAPQSRPRPVQQAQRPVPQAIPQPTSTPRPMPQQSTVEMQQSQVSLEGKSADEIRGAAEQGDAAAQMMYGAMFEDGAAGVKKDERQALRWYLKAARQGYPKAQHNLALLYEDGKGVEQDYKQAAIWYNKAAAAGFSEAQNNLAVLYILGNGVDANRDEAERLLRQAAAQGNANAKRNLNMLLNS